MMQIITGGGGMETVSCISLGFLGSSCETGQSCKQEAFPKET